MYSRRTRLILALVAFDFLALAGCNDSGGANGQDTWAGAPYRGGMDGIGMQAIEGLAVGQARLGARTAYPANNQ